MSVASRGLLLGPRRGGFVETLYVSNLVGTETFQRAMRAEISDGSSPQLTRCTIQFHTLTFVNILSFAFSIIMRPKSCFLSPVLILCSLSLAAAASWGFDEGSVSLHGKKAGVGAGAKEKSAECPNTKCQIYS